MIVVTVIIIARIFILICKLFILRKMKAENFELSFNATLPLFRHNQENIIPDSIIITITIIVANFIVIIIPCLLLIIMMIIITTTMTMMMM